MKKYKYSRKEMETKIQNLMSIIATKDPPTSWNHANQVRIDLLATQLPKNGDKEKSAVSQVCEKAHSTPPTPPVSEDKTVEGKIEPIDMEWPDEINKLVLADKINEIINYINSKK